MKKNRTESKKDKEKLTNIFDFATKELSQDAFLMWVFSNWNCKELKIRNISRKFIEFTTGIPTDEIILGVDINKQWNNIDIRVDLETEKEVLSLFIEDKTTSEEHNQLKNYNKSIDKIQNRTKKLFYKTHPMSKEEIERVKDAEWEIISFDDIKLFWGKYKNSDNLLISQYASHICNIWKDCHNARKPKDNNVDAWCSFFLNAVIPELNNCDADVQIARFSYAYLAIKPKGKMKEQMPYLEVRSRDCVNNKFRALILMYDYQEEPKEVQNYVLDKVKSKIVEYEDDKIFKSNNWEKRNKQAAQTFGDSLFATDKSFIAELQKTVDEYLKIVKSW